MLATFQVVQADNVTTVDVFTLDMNLILDMKAALTSQLITATVSFKNATLTVKSSNIGDVNANALQSTLKFVIQWGVIPLVNAGMFPICNNAY